MGLREDKKHRTRLEILAVAEAQFRGRGFDATRVRDIAAELQLSEQTVFNYFPTKESLLDALAVGWFQSLAESADQADRLGPAPDRTAPLEDFLAGVALLLRAIAADRDYMRLVFTRAPLLRDARGSFEANFAVLRRIFAALQDAGELRCDLGPQEIVEYYVTLFNATVCRWLSEPTGSESEALEARVLRALRVLFRGLRPGQEEAA